MFDSNYIEKLLPPFTRKPKQIAWLSTILINARAIWLSFLNFRTSTKECIRYNSQTLSIQTWLRDRFQNNQIVVNNTRSQADPVTLFWLFENQESDTVYWLSEQPTNEFILWLSELSDLSLYYDFIVEVPSVLMSQEMEIRAEVNKLKLAGKRFSIECNDCV